MTQPATARHDLRVLVVGTQHLAHAVHDELARRGVSPLMRADEPDLTGIDAAIFCDNDDVGNLSGALALREHAPDARIVLRSFNTRVRERLPELLGDCTVLSASRIAAPLLCDIAVDASGPDAQRRRRNPLLRVIDRAYGSHGAAIWRQLWRRALFRWTLVLLFALVVLQSLLAKIAHGYGTLEALHAGVAGIATFGFTDTGLLGPELAQQPMWLQASAITITLVDIVMFTVLLGLVADALVGERFARVFGGSARRLRGHVVIAGVGTVGFRTLRELTDRGYRCAVIERNDEAPLLASARALGAHVTIADVRQEDDFTQLALDRAVAFLALTDDDAANLEAAFTATAINPQLPVIVRCFDPELAARLEALPGIAASRSVGRLAAPQFVDAALGQ